MISKKEKLNFVLYKLSQVFLNSLYFGLSSKHITFTKNLLRPHFIILLVIPPPRLILVLHLVHDGIHVQLLELAEQSLDLLHHLTLTAYTDLYSSLLGQLTQNIFLKPSDHYIVAEDIVELFGAGRALVFNPSSESINLRVTVAEPEFLEVGEYVWPNYGEHIEEFLGLSQSGSSCQKDHLLAELQNWDASLAPLRIETL